MPSPRGPGRSGPPTEPGRHDPSRCWTEAGYGRAQAPTGAASWARASSRPGPLGRAPDGAPESDRGPRSTGSAEAAVAVAPAAAEPDSGAAAAGDWAGRPDAVGPRLRCDRGPRSDAQPSWSSSSSVQPRPRLPRAECGRTPCWQSVMCRSAAARAWTAALIARAASARSSIRSTFGCRNSREAADAARVFGAMPLHTLRTSPAAQVRLPRVRSVAATSVTRPAGAWAPTGVVDGAGGRQRLLAPARAGQQAGQPKLVRRPLPESHALDQCGRRTAGSGGRKGDRVTWVSRWPSSSVNRRALTGSATGPHSRSLIDAETESEINSRLHRGRQRRVANPANDRGQRLGSL